MKSLLIAAWIAATAASAPAATVLFANYANSSYAVDSVIWTSPAKDIEAADDFDAVGVIQRVVVDGYGCFQCAPPAVAGAEVRFYAHTPSGPGAQQAAFFVAAGNPGLKYDAANPETIDITLPAPFQATGKHFVSVRLKFNGSGFWSVWDSNKDHPKGSPLRWRDVLAGGAWGPYLVAGQPLNSDLAFQLWGTAGNAVPDLGDDPCGTWLPIDTPEPANASHAVLRDLVSISPNEAWAVGDAQVPGDFNMQGITVTARFDGDDWTIVPSPSPTGIPGAAQAHLEAVDATGPTDVWAGGGKSVQGPDGFYGLHLLVLRWNGSSWVDMNAPQTSGGSGNYVSGIKAFAPNDVWFVGDWLDIDAAGTAAVHVALAMHWDGSGFTIFDLPFFNPTQVGMYGTGHGLEAVDGVAPDDVWAVGGAHDGDYSPVSNILHWDGSSWTRVLGPEPPGMQRLFAVEAIASNDVWAGGERELPTGGYAAFAIHWDGSSWTEVPCPIGIHGLKAFASDDVYAFGGGVAHWDGSAWSLVETFPTVDGASNVAGDSAAGCGDLLTVGRRIEVGKIQNFSARMVASPWIDLGGGTPGSNGMPQLVAKGALIAGEPVLLTLSSARPNAPALLVAGAFQAPFPAFGGTLFPAPQIVISGIVTSAAGTFQAWANWPAGIPAGGTVNLQMLVADPAAQGGVALSNAVHGTAN